MSRIYLNLFTVAAFTAALFTVGTALNCYHCLESLNINNNSTLGNCSRAGWIESDCQGNASYCLYTVTKREF